MAKLRWRISRAAPSTAHASSRSGSSAAMRLPMSSMRSSIGIVRVKGISSRRRCTPRSTPPLKLRQLVRGEQVLCHRAELDAALVDVAPLDRLAGDDRLEGVGRDGLGRELVGGVQELADEPDHMPLVAHLRGGDRADRAGGQEAAGEFEHLALAVLGGLAVQDHGAGLHQPGGVAERGRAADLGQQRALRLGLRVALEDCRTAAARAASPSGGVPEAPGCQWPGSVWRQR